MFSLNLSTFTSSYTAQDGDVLTGTLDGATQPYSISIAEGATVTLSGVTINGSDNTSCDWAGITCKGDAAIVLADGTTNTVKGFYQFYPGIQPAIGKALTIKGTGTLNASSNGRGAGIGGGVFVSCGNILIEGGTINATGGTGCAGIGSGMSTGRVNTSCGTITISGGNVTAEGGDGGTAGIGCGRGNDGSTYCGAILINGGAVTATAASQGASAIGNGNAATGNESFCASITFTTGITSLTLKNSRADFSPPAGFYLNAGQVMAHTVDITKSLSGYNSYLSSFNERNPAFSELFPHSTFDADTKVWNIAP
ncbi:MAG: hypothetical protein IJL93_07555 [Bacteroidales bacterium]|nr:hypothetical protein [Bacteroidales bacterium]